MQTHTKKRKEKKNKGNLKEGEDKEKKIMATSRRIGCSDVIVLDGDDMRLDIPEIKNYKFWQTLMDTYAPILHFHKEERIFPTNITSICEHYSLMPCSSDTLPPPPPASSSSSSFHLVLTDKVDRPNSIPNFCLSETAPEESNVPCYVIVEKEEKKKKKKMSAQNTVGGDDVIRVNFFTMYPYSVGKRVLGYTWGSHFQDWEHCFIRFQLSHPSSCGSSSSGGGGGDGGSGVESITTDGDTSTFFARNTTPLSIGWKAHGRETEIPWGDASLQRGGGPKFVNGTHPVFYVARGSHGLYPKPGRFRYQKCRPFRCIPPSVTVPFLSDVCNSGGHVWETWKNWVVIGPDHYLHGENAVRKSDGFLTNLSLSIQGTNVENWTRQIDYIGHTPVQKVCGFWRLTGMNRVPISKIRERENKKNKKVVVEQKTQ